MKKKNHIGLLCCVGLLLSGCERTIDFPLTFAGEELVVLALFDPQEVMEVEVSRTAPALAPAVPWVEEARVEVYADDTLLEVLPYVRQGVYRSALGHRPLPQTSYQLKVYDQGGDSVISEKVRLPEPPQLAGMQGLREHFVTQSDTAHLLRLQGQASSSEEAYYEIDLAADSSGEIRVSIEYSFYTDYGEACNPASGRFTASCLSRDGEWAVDLPIRTKFLEPETGRPRSVDTVWVWLTTCDSATYAYYEWNPGGNFDQIFLPPQPIPSFMRGGHGILAAKQTRRFRVVMQ